MPVGLPADGSRVRMRACAGVHGDCDPGLPAPGIVDVWRIDLDAVRENMDGVLDAHERARAARIVGARKRALWVRSRGVLRMLLGRYLECDPRGLCFQMGPHGKPALADRADGTQRLRFNLSHSGSLMLVAVSGEREVGVDVELTRPRQERYTVEFLREWTRREATAKCRGTGLAAAAAGDSALSSAGASGGEASADLWIAEMDVGPHAVAALALESERGHTLTDELRPCTAPEPDPDCVAR
jgi:phosphopantetheinyl transferase